MKFSLFLLSGFLLAGCCTKPHQKAVDSLFLNGRDVYNSYDSYLQDYERRTNAFPKVAQEYEVFQQLFKLAIDELPGTNGIPAAVSTGQWVIHHVKPKSESVEAPKSFPR